MLIIMTEAFHPKAIRLKSIIQRSLIWWLGSAFVRLFEHLRLNSDGTNATIDKINAEIRNAGMSWNAGMKIDSF